MQRTHSREESNNEESQHGFKNAGKLLESLPGELGDRRKRRRSTLRAESVGATEGRRFVARGKYTFPSETFPVGSGEEGSCPTLAGPASKLGRGEGVGDRQNGARSFSVVFARSSWGPRSEHVLALSSPPLPSSSRDFHDSFFLCFLLQHVRHRVSSKTKRTTKKRQRRSRSSLVLPPFLPPFLHSPRPLITHRVLSSSPPTPSLRLLSRTRSRQKYPAALLQD